MTPIDLTDVPRKASPKDRPRKPSPAHAEPVAADPSIVHAVRAVRDSSSRQPQSGSPSPYATDSSVKHFVVDTNVLLHNPNALFVFKEHHVVIPFAVVEELDAMKRKDDDLGRNAREVIRHLDRLRNQGSLTHGVPWGQHSPATGAAASTGVNGQTGSIRIDIGEHTRPTVLDADKADNRIIAVAWHLHQQGLRAVFVSKDISARIKSDSLGIPTEDFENAKVDAEHLYTGFLTLSVPGELIDELYQNRMLPLEKLREGLTIELPTGERILRDLVANQFVVLRDESDEHHTGIARRLADTEHVIPVTGPRKPVHGIMARNVQQTMALDLLLDDEIRFITLLGSAGTGKTLFALAAGMTKVFTEQRYEKLLCARPIMPLGRDIGYLPGDKDEKLTAWMQPIFDNLSYLLSTRGGDHKLAHADSHTTEQRIAKLMADGQIVLEPLTYIRGRSIPHQFIIVDEAQNLTPHEVKTIVSRVGDGTKIILTGDIQQIDNPYLDSSSNGLAYAVERMKGLSIAGHVTLMKSERSELASIAAARL